MRIAFLLVLIAVVGGALPGRAADPVTCTLHPDAGRRFIDIAVLEQGFSPFTQQAFAGDVVRWKVGGSSHHKIGPYAPSTVAGFPITNELVPGDVHCIKFAGGSIWYRDPFSNTSIVEASGVCHGRCASISDRLNDPAAPSITPPSGPSTENPTVIAGTSEPLTLVKLADLPADKTAYDDGTPIGQALADETGAWKAYLTLDGGSHNLVARAVDAAGRESVDSTATGSTIPVEVVKDTEPPTLIGTPPAVPVITAGTTVSGRATDNGKVTLVSVVISDLRNGANLLGDSGQSTQEIRYKDFTCPALDTACAPGNVPWSFVIKPSSRFKVGPVPPQTDPTTLALPSGLFSVKITAYDSWQNKSTTIDFNVVVVGVPTIG
jgi:hypothetical protein